MADDPPEEFLEFFQDKRGLLMIQASLLSLATIPAFLFLPWFGRLVKSYEPEDGVLGSASVLAFVVGLAMVTLLGMVYAGIAFVSNETLDLVAAKNLSILVSAGFHGAFAPFAAFAAFSGLALVTGKGLTRWVGVFGLLTAVVCIGAVFGWGDDGVAAPGGPLLPAGSIVLMLYIVASCILLFRTPKP